MFLDFLCSVKHCNQRKYYLPTKSLGGSYTLNMQIESKNESWLPKAHDLLAMYVIVLDALYCYEHILSCLYNDDNVYITSR